MMYTEFGRIHRGVVHRHYLGAQGRSHREILRCDGRIHTTDHRNIVTDSLRAPPVEEPVGFVADAVKCVAVRVWRQGAALE